MLDIFYKNVSTMGMRTILVVGAMILRISETF